ncbi:MAG: hypothetical protein Q8O52_23005 [Sulfuritalea sp.]|nr:hypothetical protein [Sulfuritalea sp.]
MQLDIFEHSRDVILRNAAIDALREWNAGACVRAIAALAGEYGGDPLLPALGVLCRKVNAPPAIPLAPDAARAMLQETEDAVTAAANEVFGRAAHEWLAPLWAELAAAIAGYPFAAGDESLHAAPLLLRAGRWEDAAERIESIASWRRQPAPLVWMIEARCRLAGFEAIWPLLAELAWMAPARAQTLAPRLELSELDSLVRDFDAGFEGEGKPDDFTWFPAWALLVDRRLAAGLRLAQDGAHTPPETCARIVLGLVALERQGRHAELVEGRRKLREAHPALFARYMQDR